MAGTGDQMIRQAEEAAKAATKAREDAGRADVSNGGAQNFRNAQQAEKDAQRALTEARNRWGR